MRPSERTTRRSCELRVSTAFAVADISTVDAGFLANYEVAILAGMPLSTDQATTLGNWVNLGGNLIAMDPDPALANLLGLSPAAGTLDNGYVRINNSTRAGSGIVGETMQFHGTAQYFTLAGASSFATLYSDSVTPTAYPAVTLNRFGSGQAAAFAYDLATSIVYTRQGNPAWVGPGARWHRAHQSQRPVLSGMLPAIRNQTGSTLPRSAFRRPTSSSDSWPT